MNLSIKPSRFHRLQDRDHLILTVFALAHCRPPGFAYPHPETSIFQWSEFRRYLHERIGTIQALVSDYERDKLRLNAEMAVRFAIALEVSTDELLGLHHSNGKKQTKTNGRKASRRILRRLEKSESLPTHQKTVLLKIIDTFIKAAGK